MIPSAFSKLRRIAFKWPAGSMMCSDSVEERLLSSTGPQD